MYLAEFSIRQCVAGICQKSNFYIYGNNDNVVQLFFDPAVNFKETAIAFINQIFLEFNGRFRIFGKKLIVCDGPFLYMQTEISTGTIIKHSRFKIFCSVIGCNASIFFYGMEKNSTHTMECTTLNASIHILRMHAQRHHALLDDAHKYVWKLYSVRIVKNPRV